MQIPYMYISLVSIKFKYVIPENVSHAPTHHIRALYNNFRAVFIPCKQLKWIDRKDIVHHRAAFTAGNSRTDDDDVVISLNTSLHCVFDLNN